MTLGHVGMKPPEDTFASSTVRLVALQTFAGLLLALPASWAAAIFAYNYLKIAGTPDPHALAWFMTAVACLETLVFCPVVVAPVSLYLQKLKRAQARLERLADTDALTGLLNRRGLEKAAERLSGSGAQGAVQAALVIDIDHFKAVNDRHGHAFGDEVLRALGRLLSERFGGEAAAAARIGGEEFVTLLRVRNPRAAELAAEGVRRAFAALEIAHGSVVDRCTLSVGVAVAAAPCDPHTLMLQADDALYRAKFSGRNRVALAAAA